EEALRADMADQGIPDTLVNRERATAELMRARADMLLASPTRYPEVEGLQLKDILGHGQEEALSRPAEDEIFDTAAASLISSDLHEDLHDEILATKFELESPEPHARHASAAKQTIENASPPSIEQSDTVVSLPPVARSKRPEGQSLPISKISEKCEALIAS